MFQVATVTYSEPATVFSPLVLALLPVEHA